MTIEEKKLAISIALDAVDTFAFAYSEFITEHPKVNLDNSGRRRFLVNFGTVDPGELYEDDVEPAKIQVLVDLDNDEDWIKVNEKMKHFITDGDNFIDCDEDVNFNESKKSRPARKRRFREWSTADGRVNKSKALGLDDDEDADEEQDTMVAIIGDPSVILTDDDYDSIIDDIDDSDNFSPNALWDKYVDRYGYRPERGLPNFLSVSEEFHVDGLKKVRVIPTIVGDGTFSGNAGDIITDTGLISIVVGPKSKLRKQVADLIGSKEKGQEKGFTWMQGEDVSGSLYLYFAGDDYCYAEYSVWDENSHDRIKESYLEIASPSDY